MKSSLLNIEIPLLNKFLFCLPLRKSLIFLGLLLQIVAVVISWVAVAHYVDRGVLYGGTVTFMLVLNLLAALIEFVFGGLLVFSAYKKHLKLLEHCYSYYQIKLLGWTMVLVVSFFVKHLVYSRNWYFYNLDPLRYHLLMDNQLVGLLDLMAQGYMAILVRSQVLRICRDQRIYTLSEDLGSMNMPK